LRLAMFVYFLFFFFFSSRRRHTRSKRDWSSDVCSSDLNEFFNVAVQELADNGMNVGFTSTAGLSWAEIDDPGDLAFAREHVFPRSEERRVGKECRSRGWPEY